MLLVELRRLAIPPERPTEAPTAWRMPELQKPAPDDVSGRGLFLVDALSENWGVRPRDPGKTVWAHLALHRTGQP
ncbi:ATP-binding protein [Streptomyces nigrescens]